MKLLYQVEESRNLHGQDKLLSKAIGGDRVFGSLDNILSTHRDLSASARAFKGLCNSLSFRGSNNACRGELHKKEQHGCGEDITEGLKFREGALKDSSNLAFYRSDMMGDSLSFSGNISDISGVLRDGELLNGIFVKEDESGDSKGVLFISFGFPQREFSEIRNKKGVNDQSLNTFVSEE